MKTTQQKLFKIIAIAPIALLISASSFAGTPDEDPAVAKIQQEFESAPPISSTYEALRLGQTWGNCKTHSAMKGNFSVSDSPSVVFSEVNQIIQMTIGNSTNYVSFLNGEIRAWLDTIDSERSSIAHIADNTLILEDSDNRNVYPCPSCTASTVGGGDQGNELIDYTVCSPVDSGPVLTPTPAPPSTPSGICGITPDSPSYSPSLRTMGEVQSPSGDFKIKNPDPAAAITDLVILATGETPNFLVDSFKVITKDGKTISVSQVDAPSPGSPLTIIFTKDPVQIAEVDFVIEGSSAKIQVCGKQSSGPIP